MDRIGGCALSERYTGDASKMCETWEAQKLVAVTIIKLVSPITVHDISVFKLFFPNFCDVNGFSRLLERFSYIRLRSLAKGHVRLPHWPTRKILARRPLWNVMSNTRSISSCRPVPKGARRRQIERTKSNDRYRGWLSRTPFLQTRWWISVKHVRTSSLIRARTRRPRANCYLTHLRVLIVRR